MAYGAFKERGNYTLQALIDDDSAGTVEKAFDMILDEVARIASDMNAAVGGVAESTAG